MINHPGVILMPDTSTGQQEQRDADAELPDRPRVKDVAKWLGVHQMSVYRWIHNGDIPCKRVGKRTYIFEKAALLEWAKPQMV